MRDVIGQLAEDKRELAQENETLKNESAAVVRICENLKSELQKAEWTITILRERVSRITLEETVEDYEAIRSMDEEILETQREAEKELREELDLTNSRINNLLVQIKVYGEQVDEYERMIIKFRRKIGELNEEIQERQDEIISLNEQLKGEEDNNIMSMQSTQLTTATRTFAEIVDREVYALELKYEIELSNYLKAFLPDNFSKPGGDGDAILLTIRFSRLSAKTTLLIKLLNLKYPPAPGGIRREHVTKSHKAEQWAHCAKFSFLLSNFGCAVRQCERYHEKCFSVVRRCTVERLLRLAPLQSDIAREEGIIDQYIDLLRNDKFDENISLDGVNKAINYLKNVLSVHFSREWYDSRQLFLDVCAQLLQGLFWVKINAQRIIFTLSHIIESSSTKEYMESVLAWVERCEQLCIRLKNRISIGENLIFTQDLEIELANWNTVFKNVASIFDSVCSVANIQLSTNIEAESLEENCIQEALLYSVEKVHGALNGAEVTEVINEYMRTVQNVITNLIDKFDNQELLGSTVDKSVLSPLMERANARRQDALEAEKLCWNLEKKENEITELKMNLRAKLDDISNYKVRLEMAENKIESLEKVDETEMQKLYSQNDDLRDQLRKAKIEYEDTLETLQHEIDVCEKENCELRNRARTISKKQLQTINLAMNHSKMQATLSPTDSNPSTPKQFNEVAYLEYELKETKLALEWACQHIRQLKANERLQMLNLMDSITFPSDISGPLTLLSVQASKKDELDELCRRAENILADSRFYQIPYVADISQSKSKQDLEKKKFLGNIAHINQRIADVLRIDIHRFCYKYRQSREWPSLFENIKSITSYNRKDFPSALNFLLQKEERTEIHRLKGVHSVAYKNAFESLFGNLNTEQKRTESTEIAVYV
uniref:Dynactin domain-containing protein n=1 Tax=Elaeophora elaphi TaxID=1147741 RepID=A0A0R3RJ42_9BILA